MAEAAMPRVQETEVFFDRRWSPKVPSVNHDGSQPDIVVVHDLGSHRPTSWIQGEETDVGVCWLEDVLERDLPRAEIMSFRLTPNAALETVYRAGAFKARGVELLKSICEHRHKVHREIESRIIFVFTGIGSLIVKRALLIAQDDNRFKSIRDRTSNLVSIGPVQPTVDFRSRETLALNLAFRVIGASIESYRHSLSRTIEMFSVAETEICEDFSAIAGRYKMVAVECSSILDVPSEEQFYTERKSLKRKPPPEEIEDEVLMISDKIRSLAKSDSISQSKWYPDYISMLSHLQRQQYTCTPVSKHPQTLDWFLSNTTYLAWLGESDPSMLYIHGQCGVGKTTLSSFLWKSVRTVSQAREAGAITTLYFSFLREDKRRNSIRSMLSSIINQLLACRPQIFLSFWNHDVWIKWYKPLTVEELWIIFRSLISSPVHDGIICIIDAIDQCDIPFDTTLQELLAFSASREAKFKMVVTSRVSPERLHLLPRFSINLDLQKEKEMDLNASTKIYASDLLQGNAAFLGLEQDIVEKFQNRGTHLDVFLGFESLKNPTLRSTPWSMKTQKSLSYGPSDVCGRVLNEFAELPPWACTALSWIVHAFRPLTFEELSIAIAICDTTTSYSEIEIDVPRDIVRDLKQVFGGMLSFNYDEIRFVHQSVKDYLLTHLTSPPSQDHLSSSLTHTDLAKRCLAYLSFADLEDRSPSEPVSWDYSPPGKSNFLGYATEYWPEHYQKAEERDRLYGDVLRFLENGEHLEKWNKSRSVKRHTRDWPPHPVSSLQSAAELGLTEIVTKLLLQDDGTSIAHNDKEAALDMAVDNSHLEAAIQLLNSGTTSRRALSLAARHGNTELVKQLIDRNALEASEIDGLSPFHEAALRGHTSVIGTLLEAGAIPKSINSSEVTPFSLAVKGGQLVALQQLLGANRTVALADDTEFSLLHLAAREGHLEIVRELIKVDADPNAIDSRMSTPLLLAAQGGHAVLVKELIDNLGADVQANQNATF